MALSFGMALPAHAQENARDDYTSGGMTGGVVPVTAPANPASTAKTKNYFVEFRSRSALSYGHTFLVHGKLNAQGQIGKVSKGQVAGLHPFSESSVPWMIGHLIPVIAERGWSDGDDEDEYVTAAYRVTMTEQEYARVSAYIRSHQKNSPMWHAVLYNCNAWVGDVAKFMGLKAPDNTLAYPEEYISGMAKLNGATATRPNPTPARSGAKPTTAGAPKPATAAAPKPKPAATAAVATANPAAAAATPAAATPATATPAAPTPAAAATSTPAAATDSAPKPAVAAAPATPKPAAKPAAAKPPAQTTAQTTAAVPIPFPERY